MIGSLLVYGIGDRITRRFAGVVVGFQTLAVFFGALVAYAIAKSQGNSEHTAYLVLGLLLALLCVIAAGSLWCPWGVTLGWFVQILVIASTVIVPMMLIVGVMFLALWITALMQGGKMDRLAD